MASNFDSFITNDLVMRARREEIEPHGPLIVGVDPAGKGADSTAIAWRRGHCIVKTERCRGLDTMEVAGWVAQIIREDKPAKVNIDVGGLGIGVYDRLIEQGHDSGVVTAVNFGGKPIGPPPPLDGSCWRLMGRGWDDNDKDADYDIRMARSLLIEFVGGEPAQQLQKQFVA